MIKKRCYSARTMLLHYLLTLFPCAFVPDNYCYRGKCQFLGQQSHYDKCHTLSNSFNQDVVRKTSRKIVFEKISVQ
jgi:hypothetical protein